MIASDGQLKVTQDQMQRLEYALATLRRTATKGEFAAQAPAIIEHIRRMRDEIDTYLGVYEVETTSFRWLRSVIPLSLETQPFVFPD